MVAAVAAAASEIELSADAHPPTLPKLFRVETAADIRLPMLEPLRNSLGAVFSDIVLVDFFRCRAMAELANFAIFLYSAISSVIVVGNVVDADDGAVVVLAAPS